MPESRLSVSERNIDVWLAFYDEIVDERLLSSLHTLLNEAEQHQQQRFHFADDRKRYLVTRSMVRTVLSRYAAIDPVDWTFSTNRYGRPEIANTDSEVLGLSFNISHTRGLIVLGVTQRRALGVDVENVFARRMSLGVANRFFSPAEAAELSRAPLAQQQERFFEYWVFKESYIKARGMGLSIPLDQFSFSFPNKHAVRIAIQPELGDDANRWSFWQYRPTPEYMLAVCAERMDGESPELTIRKMVPMGTEEALDLKFRRISESVDR